jgi:hypothetical protein
MHPRLAMKPKQRTTKVENQPSSASESLTPVDFALENRFSTQTAAYYLGIRSETLARWRSERRLLGVEQPNFYRIGKKITYLKHDLDAFLLKRGRSVVGDFKITLTLEVAWFLNNAKTIESPCTKIQEHKFCAIHNRRGFSRTPD